MDVAVPELIAQPREVASPNVSRRDEIPHELDIPSEFSIEQNSDHTALLVRVRGHLSDENLRELKPALEELERSLNHPSILFDIRDVTDFSGLSARFVREMAQSEGWSRCHDGEMSRRAIVVSSTGLYGLGRLYQLSTGSSGDEALKIFRDVRSALEYVGFLGEAGSEIGIGSPATDCLT